MAFEILESIRQAEKKADELKAQSQQESREILKACEEALVQLEKENEAALRARYAERMAALRQEAQAVIEEKAALKQRQFDALLRQAEALLPRAADLIAERVLHHGDR